MKTAMNSIRQPLFILNGILNNTKFRPFLSCLEVIILHNWWLPFNSAYSTIAFMMSSVWRDVWQVLVMRFKGRIYPSIADHPPLVSPVIHETWCARASYPIFAGYRRRRLNGNTVFPHETVDLRSVSQIQRAETCQPEGILSIFGVQPRDQNASTTQMMIEFVRWPFNRRCLKSEAYLRKGTKPIN